MRVATLGVGPKERQRSCSKVRGPWNTSATMRGGRLKDAQS